MIISLLQEVTLLTTNFNNLKVAQAKFNESASAIAAIREVKEGMPYILVVLPAHTALLVAHTPYVLLLACSSRPYPRIALNMQMCLMSRYSLADSDILVPLTSSLYVPGKMKAGENVSYRLFLLQSRAFLTPCFVFGRCLLMSELDFSLARPLSMLKIL